MSNVRLSVEIPCKLGWIRRKGYDNSTNRDTKLTVYAEVNHSVEIKAIEFTKTVNEYSKEKALKMHADVSVGAVYKVIEASVSAGIEHSSVMKDFLSATKEVTRQQDTKTTSIRKEELTIGPGDQMYFYQRVFQGPGMSCTLEETLLSGDPNLADKWKDVEITATTRPQQFIKHMRVAYGDGEAQAPENHVREIDGKSADINKGQKGKWVWMEPVWDYASGEAATGFEIRIQKNHHEGWEDLAKGASGDYRYVYTNHNEREDTKVIDAKLIRSGAWLSPEAQKTLLSEKLGKGWVAVNRDINENRGGDFLYLVYKLF